MFNNVVKKITRVFFEDEGSLRQAFLRSVDMNDIRRVSRFLNEGIDPNLKTTNNNYTALHIAAINNYYTLTQMLISNPRIKIDSQDNLGCTPLFLACGRNNIDIVKLLLQNNANVNTCTKFGNTALHEAVLYSFPEVVKLLLNYNANVNCENVFGRTPFHIAILDTPSEYIATLLFKSGADINSNNGLCLPILLECALNCHNNSSLNMMEYLLDLGADVNIKDYQSGCTALHMIAISGYVPAAEILISYGGNILIRDKQRRTPLDIAKKQMNYNVAYYFEMVLQLFEDHKNSFDKINIY